MTQDARSGIYVEKLTAAREYLMAHGWHQGELYEGDDMPAPACGFGAVDAVCRVYGGHTNDEVSDALWCLLDRVAAVMYPERAFQGPEELEPDPSFPNFNDHDETTFNDVMAVYDEAIRVAKEMEASLGR